MGSVCILELKLAISSHKKISYKMEELRNLYYHGPYLPLDFYCYFLVIFIGKFLVLLTGDFFYCYLLLLFSTEELFFNLGPCLPSEPSSFNLGTFQQIFAFPSLLFQNRLLKTLFLFCGQSFNRELVSAVLMNETV